MLVRGAHLSSPCSPEISTTSKLTTAGKSRSRHATHQPANLCLGVLQLAACQPAGFRGNCNDTRKEPLCLALTPLRSQTICDLPQTTAAAFTAWCSSLSALTASSHRACHAASAARHSRPQGSMGVLMLRCMIMCCPRSVSTTICCNQHSAATSSSASVMFKKAAEHCQA